MSEILEFAFSAAVLSILVGLWTRAWLCWMWGGQLRQAAVFLMPAAWLCGSPRQEAYEMTPLDFDAFMMAEFEGPYLVAKGLTCSFCSAAWWAGAGALLVSCASGIGVLGGAIIWGCGAGAAFTLFSTTKQ